MSDELRSRVGELCEALTERAAARPGGGWFEPKAGPFYVRILHHNAERGVRSTSPSTFAFAVKHDAPFGWGNLRAGDLLAPRTSRQPWKMDTGAVASLFAPDRGVSYWTLRYGEELGLW